MSNEEKTIAVIWLLEQEIDALRSVLSEWEFDKNCFTQMHKANAIREVFNCIRMPLHKGND